MRPVEWKVISASVAGFSHVAEGLACQDFCSDAITDDGWMVAAISDGAGSAHRSVEGAMAICKGMTSLLWENMPKITNGTQLKNSAAQELIRDGIEGVRAALAEIAAEDPLSCFHATLIGVLAGGAGGLFFHIGDGAACAINGLDFSRSIISPPENAEYANETFFFTQDDWEQHLRFTTFDEEFKLISLMSDGVTPFALSAASTELHVPFFEPVSMYLNKHSIEEGQKALSSTLENEAIRKITGDDKTFLWAIRTSPGE